MSARTPAGRDASAEVRCWNLGLMNMKVAMPDNAILFEIEPVCDAFDAAWIDGEVPEIAAFLQEVASDKDGRPNEERASVLFEELLAIDVEYRKQRGLPNDASFYTPRFPDYLDIIAKKAPRAPASGRLSDYVIEEEVGRGGMGVVHRARQLSLNRTVALKRLPAHAVSSPEAVLRFQRESQAAAGLDHRGIVPIFEAGEDDGVFFFAMQLIEGESLDKIRRRLIDGSAISSVPPKSLSPSQSISSSDSSNPWPVGPNFATLAEDDPGAFHHAIARVGLQVAEALVHAHERGVIHRDIKPSNLLLDRRGVVWVADFGLAQVENSDLTESGDFVGTLRYMSPERLDGRGDERGDLYGLGATLYELITRRTLFAATEPGLLIEWVRDREPARPRIVDGRIPSDLETIILKALSKEPGQRYSSAAAMAEDLRRFLNGRTILARRAGSAEKVARWAKRHRALAIALGTITLLLIVSVIVSTIAAAQFKSQSLENARLAESEGHLRGVAEERQAELTRNLYVAQMNLAGTHVSSSGGIDSLRGWVEPWRNPSPELDDPRGWEWWLLDNVAYSGQIEIESGQILLDVAWHPTKSLLASGGAQVLVWNAANGTVEHESPPLDLVSSVRWSPNGDRLAAGGRFGVQVWSTDGWSELLHFEEGFHQTRAVAWRPDGAALAIQRAGANELIVVEIESERIIASTMLADSPMPTKLAFSLDGSLLIVGAKDGNVLVLDSTNLKLLHEFDGHTAPLQATAFSPDGRLATAGTDPTIRIWDPLKGRLLAELQGHDQRVTSLSFFGTERLASASWDHTVRIWDVNTALELARLRGHSHNVTGVDWSPDGREVASASWDRSIMIWDVNASATPTIHSLRTMSQMINSRVSWAPDEDWFIASNGMDSMRIPTDERTESPEVLDDLALLTVMSPDGRKVATLTDVAGIDAIEIRAWPSQDLIRSFPHNTTNRRVELLWHPNQPLITLLSPSELRIIPIGEEPRAETRIESEDSLYRSCCWSPDGDRLVVTHAREVRTMSWPELEVLGTWEGPSTVTRVALCPDGSQLAVSSMNPAALILDARTMAETCALNGHALDLVAIAWHPDGTRVATTSLDRTVRIWDPTNGELLLVIEVERTIIELSWSSNGRILAAISDHGIVHQWDAGSSFVDR